MAIEIPKSMEEAGKWTSEKLGQLKEGTVENANRVLDWFKDAFTRIKEKGLKEGLVIPLLGYLNVFDKLGKREQPSNENLQQLRQEVDQNVQAGRKPIEPQIDKPVESNDTLLDKGTRILKAAKQAMDEKITGLHCWDWAEKVYKLAGIPRGPILFNSVKDYGMNCGEHPAPPDKLDQIRPGDWLFIHNRNSSDAFGNHSVIFVEWIDKEKRIAKTVSCPGQDMVGQINPRVDFNKNPVTYISKPA
jgi:hypothetical protein